MLAQTVDYARTILNAAAERGIGLRLAGSVAIVMRCPARYEQRRQQDWTPSDLDFVCVGEQALKLEELFRDLDYKNDRRMLVATEGRRWTLYSQDNSQLIDVFFDRMEFCHSIDLRGRVTIDSETLTLADLLLSKLQYIAPRRDDIEDIISILKTYPLGDGDASMIYLDRVSDVLKDSWGFYYTSSLNLGRVQDQLKQNPDLSAASAQAVQEQIDLIRHAVDARPKGMFWKIRALIGPRLKWYNDVEKAETF